MSLIFDIKRYAINDGPGIRITLFMKGCPLSCIWCHNPEGIRNGKDKLYTAKKCLGCGTCLKVCPNGALTLAPEGIITDKQNACYADAVPKNVRQWLSRYQERNIPPNT